jgi:hypothetical protein
MNTKALKDEIKRLNKLIVEKDAIIEDLNENIHMHIFEGLLRISDEFSILLNPPPIEIKGTYKNKSEKYLLKVEDIVQITSNGKYKEIWLKSKIPGRGESERNTDKIIVNSKWEDLIKKIDNMGFHLVKVDKGTYVNVRYFSLNEHSIRIEENEKVSLKLLNIRYDLDKDRISVFMNMKDNFNRVLFQKDDFRSIAQKMMK